MPRDSFLLIDLAASCLPSFFVPPDCRAALPCALSSLPVVLLALPSNHFELVVLERLVLSDLRKIFHV